MQSDPKEDSISSVVVVDSGGLAKPILVDQQYGFVPMPDSSPGPDSKPSIKVSSWVMPNTLEPNHLDALLTALGGSAITIHKHPRETGQDSYALTSEELLHSKALLALVRQQAETMVAPLKEHGLSSISHCEDIACLHSAKRAFDIRYSVLIGETPGEYTWQLFIMLAARYWDSNLEFSFSVQVTDVDTQGENYNVHYPEFVGPWDSFSLPETPPASIVPAILEHLRTVVPTRIEFARVAQDLLEHSVP